MVHERDKFPGTSMDGGNQETILTWMGISSLIIALFSLIGLILSAALGKASFLIVSLVGGTLGLVTMKISEKFELKRPHVVAVVGFFLNVLFVAIGIILLIFAKEARIV